MLFYVFDPKFFAKYPRKLHFSSLKCVFNSFFNFWTIIRIFFKSLGIFVFVQLKINFLSLFFLFFSVLSHVHTVFLAGNLPCRNDEGSLFPGAGKQHQVLQGSRNRPPCALQEHPRGRHGSPRYAFETRPGFPRSRQGAQGDRAIQTFPRRNRPCRSDQAVEHHPGKMASQVRWLPPRSVEVSGYSNIFVQYSHFIHFLTLLMSLIFQERWEQRRIQGTRCWPPRHRAHQRPACRQAPQKNLPCPRKNQPLVSFLLTLVLNPRRNSCSWKLSRFWTIYSFQHTCLRHATWRSSWPRRKTSSPSRPMTPRRSRRSRRESNAVSWPVENSK